MLKELPVESMLRDHEMVPGAGSDGAEDVIVTEMLKELPIESTHRDHKKRFQRRFRRTLS